MAWLELVIKTNREMEETVTDILLDCGAGGVSVEDPFLINRRIREQAWDAYEFPDEMLARDHILVKVYLPADEGTDGRLREIEFRLAALKAGPGMPGAQILGRNPVKEEDWAHSWKAYYKPVRIGNRLVVKPEWEEYRAAPGEVVVELDPGVAFGTGTHPTTVMCLKLLEKVIRGGETVFDIGTGSGILSVAAAKLGASAVWAVDIDEMAVRAARANVGLNGLEDKIRVTAGNLLDNVEGQADIVLANIVADIIIRVCPEAARAVRSGGIFIASGIIASRQDEVLEHLRRAGFVIGEVLREGEWVSLLAYKEG